MNTMLEPRHDHDVVVCGAVLLGSVIADRLAEDSYIKVLPLEASGSDGATT